VAFLLSSVLAGCASDPNAVLVGVSWVSFKVTQIGPQQYSVSGHGAGVHSEEDVKEAFDRRAAQLCGSMEAVQQATTSPYTYNSSGGGLYFTHKAFRRTGVVTCK
jgi:hypothetical protein